MAKHDKDNMAKHVKDNKKKEQKNRDKDHDSSSSTVSCDITEISDLHYDSDFDSTANLEILKKHFEKILDHKLLLATTKIQGEVDALHRVIKDKDEVISKLSVELGELKKSYDFLTEETTTLNGRININEKKLDTAAKKNEFLHNKTSDLEDRSRRNNVVFYNIPEASPESNTTEDCESKIQCLLRSRDFFEEGYIVEMDRAHRLGRKRENEQRPRPIIVRFTFYKDKEKVLQQGKLFRGCDVSASGDFSKSTLDIHKQLVTHAKAARATLNSDTKQMAAITHFRVTYRRVLLTYTSNKSSQTANQFTKSFGLEYINENKNWFIPSSRTSYVKNSNS